MNALDLDMSNAINSQLREWRENPSSAPRVILLSGEGASFCGGGDNVISYKAFKQGLSAEQMSVGWEMELRACYGLSQIQKQQRVALWDGFVMGAGVGLSWHSQFTVATENTMWAMPETKIGFFADVGASYFLPRRLGVPLALYIALTGYRFKGIELVQFGLATHLLKSEKIHELCAKLRQ